MKRLLLLLLPLIGLARIASAQPAATPPAGTIANVEVDPIRCWWRTSAGAVRIGEAFDLSLTCAVLQNDAVQVVPDETHLDSNVIAMAPFEVIRGSHPADMQSGQRRFFQYQYTLRIINPDAIGKDLKIPETVIHYKVNSRIAANTSQQGRDLVYLLPTMGLRIASMVPADAVDIRDQAGENFASVDSLELRAGTLQIVGSASMALGGLMILLVLVRLARRATKRTPSDERTLSPRSIASAAVRELTAVQRDRDQHGWSEALAGRALAATRVAAASAIDHPVSQRLAEAGTSDGAGRVVAPAPFRGKARVLSSPVTAADIARRLARSLPADAGRQQVLEGLQTALATLSLSQYGRAASLDQSALDSALSSAVDAAGRVQGEHSWLKELLQKFFGGGAAPVASRV